MSTFDNGKTSTFLKADAETQAWVLALEDRGKAGLMAEQVPGIDEAWKSAIFDGCWKLNLPATCQRFGGDLQEGCWVAVVLEMQGVWCWKECAGLKSKALQIKVFSGKAGGS